MALDGGKNDRFCSAPVIRANLDGFVHDRAQAEERGFDLQLEPRERILEIGIAARSVVSFIKLPMMGSHREQRCERAVPFLHRAHSDR